MELEINMAFCFPLSSCATIINVASRVLRIGFVTDSVVPANVEMQKRRLCLSHPSLDSLSIHRNGLHYIANDLLGSKSQQPSSRACPWYFWAAFDIDEYILTLPLLINRGLGNKTFSVISILQRISCRLSGVSPVFFLCQTSYFQVLRL